MDIKRWFSIFTLGAKQAPLMIGGQAVMEGVMMKSRQHLATAVRKPNGKIAMHHRKERSFSERIGISKVPLLRGAIMLFEEKYGDRVRAPSRGGVGSVLGQLAHGSASSTSSPG